MKKKLNDNPNLDGRLGRMEGNIEVLQKDIKYLKESAISAAIQMKQLETKVDTESAETRRQMLGFKDEVLSELQMVHQEITMLGGQYQRCEEGFEDHDKRICHLETKVFVKATS